MVSESFLGVVCEERDWQSQHSHISHLGEVQPPLCVKCSRFSLTKLRTMFVHRSAAMSCWGTSLEMISRNRSCQLWTGLCWGTLRLFCRVSLFLCLLIHFASHLMLILFVFTSVAVCTMVEGLKIEMSPFALNLGKHLASMWFYPLNFHSMFSWPTICCLRSQPNAIPKKTATETWQPWPASI